MKKNVHKIANELSKMLINDGFQVHQHKSKTNSVYLSLDCGASLKIRISDHKGTPCAYNVVPDSKRPKNDIYHNISYYSYDELEQLVKDAKFYRQQVIKEIGANCYEERKQSGLLRLFPWEEIKIADQKRRCKNERKIFI